MKRTGVGLSGQRCGRVCPCHSYMSMALGLDGEALSDSLWIKLNRALRARGSTRNILREEVLAAVPRAAFSLAAGSAIHGAMAQTPRLRTALAVKDIGTLPPVRISRLALIGVVPAADRASGGYRRQFVQTFWIPAFHAMTAFLIQLRQVANQSIFVPFWPALAYQ